MDKDKIIEKLIIKTLKSRSIRFKCSNYVGWTYNCERRRDLGIGTQFDLSIVKNSRRCKHCNGIIPMPRNTEIVGMFPSSSVQFIFTTSMEFTIIYKFITAKGNVRSGWKYETWQHSTTIDLSDPESFTKLQEFITRHLPRGKSK